ncbi:tyrosine-type recombinase/integrase [Xanthomonas campestris pv. campestris]|uniref:tyrosine-type recombinase/integrase n=1 Tax=Xanthomonas campestris TaxID=339 RepID=UPI002AD2A400|nr:integrase arm-type DNA-binding domain-containing protein [Xanthomonas campestris]MEA0709485.1 tyrosine-type recombinase/integrase [Xanthomonas campestris pv. campestris]MEA0742662.1 tyrosine-type recombinase/integrase [Xanthomonas campestris pv. campestris]
MAAIYRLTAAQIESAKKGRMQPGTYFDGGLLLLRIGKNGAASWTFRHTKNGVRREVGLGSLSRVSLAVARRKADAMRAGLGEGIAPAPARSVAPTPLPGRLTFKQAAERFMDSKVSALKSAKHRQQWANTLETYAYPVIGGMDVAAIETAHVLEVLTPIWGTKNETAARLRGRIERVLAWATVSGHRAGSNPAAFRGHLSEALPSRSLVQTKGHHAALPYAQLPDFMRKVAAMDGVAAMALRFTVLCAARTGETIGARWSEIDLDEGVWSIPAARMKGGRDHRVALSGAALEILRYAATIRDGDYVFPGGKRAQPLSNMSLLAVIRRAGVDGVTTHGMRSCFRDWAGQETHHARETIEHALAHSLRSKTEAAYARGDLLKKRAALMSDWADFCAPQVS